MQKTNPRPTSPFFYLAIALVTVGLCITFLFSRLAPASAQFSSQPVSPVAGLMHLKTLEKTAMSYEEAIANGKPTFLEFYADWCTVCQSMATTIEQLQAQQGETVNFVMLNIDDPIQSERVAAYRVTGVPHFIALNPEHEVVDSIVGRVPGGVLGQTLAELSAVR